MSSYYVIQLGWVPKFAIYVRSHYRDFLKFKLSIETRRLKILKNTYSQF